MKSKFEELVDHESNSWWKDRLLDNGSLSVKNIKSEYERGFIDCWNFLWKTSLCT